MSSPSMPRPSRTAVDELGVGHQVVEEALHLDCAEPGFEGGLEAGADVAHQLGERAALRQTGEDRRVRREHFLPGAAEQLVHRPAELLAREVVERDVDRRERVDAESAPTRVQRRFVQLVDQRGDWKRVAADDEVADVPAPDVEVGLLDESAHEVGWSVGLADARPALLVRQADDDGIGGPIAVARVDGRRDDGNDLEAGDRRAHGAPCGRGGSAERIGAQTSDARPSSRYWLAPFRASDVRSVEGGWISILPGANMTPISSSPLMCSTRRGAQAAGPGNTHRKG